MACPRRPTPNQWRSPRSDDVGALASTTRTAVQDRLGNVVVFSLDTTAGRLVTAAPDGDVVDRVTSGLIDRRWTPYGDVSYRHRAPTGAIESP